MKLNNYRCSLPMRRAVKPFNIKFRREYLVKLNKIKAQLGRGTVSLRAGQLITASRQDRSNQSLYYVVQCGSMLWVFEWNPVVWPFKWNLLSISWELGFFLQRGFDVFNALDLMENKEFLEKLKFGIGDGNLQYYLYNWKCPFMEPEKVSYIALFYPPVILPWVWKAVCETLSSWCRERDRQEETWDSRVMETLRDTRKCGEYGEQTI